jgi:hypothetical protein
MVISPPNKGIIVVILGDGECLPENLNSEKVIVFRQGDSTDRQLLKVKELGVLADASLLRVAAEPVCNYSGNGNPLHEHKDETWWFYDETWAYENGPYLTFEEGLDALQTYCVELQTAREAEVAKAVEEERKDLTDNQSSDMVSEGGNNDSSSGF